jgi:CRP-like cAMP-binding protein
MANRCFWYLENVDMRQLMDPKKMMDGSLDELTHKTFKKGEYIYHPEDVSDKVFFVREGRVKVGNYSAEGKEITKTILSAGEVFGELAVIGEETRRDFAQALEPTTLCIVSVEEMKSLMKHHSGLSLFFMKLMGNRMLDMEQRLESLVFKDSRSRIVEFLINLVNKRGQRVGYEMLVRKFFTHQEIANLTATSRQTVTTVLNELRSKNLLTFDRRRLLVRDMVKLKSEMEVFHKS